VRALRYGRGEAAREGDPAVVAWADGARNGSGVTQQAAAPAPARSFRRSVRVADDGLSFVAPAAVRVAAPSVAGTLPHVRNPHARGAEPPAISTDLLLVCRRRNV